MRAEPDHRPPYIFGGGDAAFTSPGYDCSVTFFALHGASLLSTEGLPEFEGWGGGIGQWVTVSRTRTRLHDGRGPALDTSAVDDPPTSRARWRLLRPANGGFKARHPVGRSPASNVRSRLRRCPSHRRSRKGRQLRSARFRMARRRQSATLGPHSS